MNQDKRVKRLLELLDRMPDCQYITYKYELELRKWFDANVRDDIESYLLEIKVKSEQIPDEQALKLLLIVILSSYVDDNEIKGFSDSTVWDLSDTSTVRWLKKWKNKSYICGEVFETPLGNFLRLMNFFKKNPEEL